MSKSTKAVRLPAPKVLFIAPNRIGDSVIASGAIREILRQTPGARITVASGGPPAPFYRSAPGVERVLVVEKLKSKMHWPKLWAQVVGTRWDLIIDGRGSILAWLTPARRRRVYSRAMEHGAPKVEMIARLLGAPRALEPELFIDDRARAEAAAVVDPQTSAAPGPILALAPIAVQPGKSWPAERWGELTRRLRGEPRFAGWRIMLVGGPGPGDRAAATPALTAAGPAGVDFVGKGDILASAAAIQRAALFVGNDSGLMHVAAAAGVPTLGLFGPTEWWLYGPRGPKTRTVAANPRRGEFAPIEALTVDQVFAAVLDLHDAFVARGQGTEAEA